MKKKPLGRINKTAIVVALIIGASILGYGYMNYRYKKEALEEKIRSEQQAKEDKEEEEYQRHQSYLRCKGWAEKDYHLNWTNECESKGLKEGCSLPLENSDRLNSVLDKEIDNCFRLWKE